MDLDESMAGLPVDEIERRAAACSEAWTAYAEEASLPHEHAPRREAYEKASRRFGTGQAARGVLALIARVRAAEAERDRLLALFDEAGQGEHDVLALVDHYQEEARRALIGRDEAYPRALQAAADVVYQALTCDMPVGIAAAILALSADEIDAFAEQQEQAHRAESGEQ